MSEQIYSEAEPSTAIEKVADVTTQEVELVQEYGSHDLLQFHRDLQLAYGFAQSLVKTPFVPQQYQGNPGHAAAAIMTARGVGIKDPMTALRSIDVIQGTPAFRANTLRALAQAAGHEIWVEEANSQRAIVKGRRKGTDQVQESLWDMDRAKAMGLLGKDNWKKQPQAMLAARATSEVARLIAADRLAGMYSIEELADGETPEETVSAPVKAPAKRTMRRKPVQKSEPEKPEPEAAPTVTESTPEMTSDPDPKEVVADVVPEPVKPEQGTSIPGEGDPLKPTAEELEEWGLLPEGFES